MAAIGELDVMHSSLQDMSAEEARAILRNDQAPFVDWCEAAFRLCSLPGASFEDWLLCLRRRGLPAETGACKLYVVTKRPRANDGVESMIFDHDDWRDYLRHEKLIA